ncbi:MULTISPECIES: hypothetical protein [unclassified Mesorhizobium]
MFNKKRGSLIKLPEYKGQYRQGEAKRHSEPWRALGRSNAGNDSSRQYREEIKHSHSLVGVELEVPPSVVRDQAPIDIRSARLAWHA